MGKSLVVGVLAVALATPLVRADGHLVSADAARSRLKEAAAAHEQNLRVVDRVLASPHAASAAAKLGVDLSRVRGAVPTLSEVELRDLADRASALETDPAAGLSGDVHELLIIFLIVAIVVVVLKAV